MTGKAAQEGKVPVTQSHGEQLEQVFWGEKILQRKLCGVERETSIVLTFGVHFAVHNTKKAQQWYFRSSTVVLTSEYSMNAAACLESLAEQQ